MTNQTAAPGWYHAEGDPAGTQRYWDGAQWSAEPVPPPPTQPNPMAPGYPSTNGATAATGDPFERNFWENFRFVAFENYANFDGRARRREYWLFTLAHIVIGVALIFPTLFFVDENEGITGLGWLPFGLAVIFGLAMIIPSIAVAVRRLHDTDRSGKWYFVSLIPYLGGLILFVMLAIDGTAGANRYGPDPKWRS